MESSESDESSTESEIENSEPDDEMEDLNDGNEEEFISFIDAAGIKRFVPKCDDQLKPHISQHIPNMEDAYKFYFIYRQTCGFDVRRSTERSKRGKLFSKYIQCNRGGSPGQKKSIDEDGVEITKKRRKTTSRRCNCKAQMILKPAGSNGLVVTSFIEEHNHPLAYGAARMFLRCNRNVSIDQELYNGLFKSKYRYNKISRFSKGNDGLLRSCRCNCC